MKVGFRKEKFDSFPIIKGRERVLIIGMNEKRRSIFAICELESIIASHNEKTFATSLEYPTDEKGRNVNDRNYAKDKNAQAKVKSVAQNLEPDMLISTSPNPSGTPIISLDGIVVSGNNRVMSLKLAKSDYPEVYQNYVKVLKREIDYGGYGGRINLYDLAQRNSFESPVLVRIDLDFKEYNSTELNKYNVVREKSEKQIDKSIRISQLLQKNEGCKNKLIELINEQEVVSELYNNKNSVARFKAILLECGLITENDISALFTATSLSEQGKIMYNTILLSLVLNENSLEISQNDGIRSYTRNVVNAILPLIKNKSLSKGSLISYVNDSFLIQNDLVNGGFKHLNDYIKQSKLGFEEESNEFKNKKALIINEVVNSGFSKLKNVLTKYNSSMEQNIEPDMFGEQLSEDEIFNKTFGVEVDEKTVSLIDKLENNMGDYTFTYKMLGRLQSDCEAFLYNKTGSESRLWAGSVEEQIAEMKKLYNQLPENGKPEWLSYNDILEYEKKMLEIKYPKTKGIFNPNGYGENLNELFNEWNVSKTEDDYNNWKEKVCRSFVGTYQNEMLSDKVDNFVLDKHKDSFQFKSFKNELKNAYKWCFKKYDKKEIVDLNRPQELTGQSFENLVHSVQGESFQYTEKMYPNKKAVGFIRITGTPIDRLGGATTVPKEEAFVGNIITLDNGEKAKILYVRKSNKELLEESGDEKYDWDFEFSTGSLKGEKFSNQKIEAIDVYDDSYYTLNFMSGGIYTATTSDMVNLLSITDNVVKISVIFDDNNVKSNQKIKRRIKSFADKSGRLIVENNSNDKIDKRQFPYLLVSKKDSENYDLASIFYGRLDTPNKVFVNDLINKYRNHNESKENIRKRKGQLIIENKLNLLNLMMKSAKGSAKELIEKKIKVLNLMNK